MALTQLLPIEMLLSMLNEYKWVILFYAVLIGVIYRFRDKFDWQNKFIGLYRTKFGLQLMERLGKHQRIVKTLGYIGIVVGYIGMIFIVGMLFKGFYDLLFVPNAPPVVSPVLPGVPIPGLGIKVPLVTGWLALFIVIVIHEFSHGVVARAHKIPVTSSGLMVFGPLGGAFVEPEEKKMAKATKAAQLSVFAAGPFSNLLTSALFFLAITFLLVPAAGMMIDDGILFQEIQPGFPAAEAGLEPEVIYTLVNQVPVSTWDEFYGAIEDVQPGDSVLFEAPGKEPVVVTATAHPDDAEKGYLGVVPGTNVKPGFDILLSILLWFSNLLMWTFVLGLGIGLANLLPMGPVDGGRMLKTGCEHFFGEKTGQVIWAKVSIVMVSLLIILLLIPFLVKPIIGIF
jgi:membrane-associated protease RseP (regulator of RpoE activity)